MTDLVFLDTPRDWTSLTRHTVVSGWTATDTGIAPSVEIDGKPIHVHEVDRPDVAKAHPNLRTSGHLLFAI